MANESNAMLRRIAVTVISLPVRGGFHCSDCATLRRRLNAFAPRNAIRFTSQSVMAITVKDAYLGEASFHWRKTDESAP